MSLARYLIQIIVLSLYHYGKGSNTLNSSQSESDKVDNLQSQLPAGATPYEKILDKA
jgi:hypothetical protein